MNNKLRIIRSLATNRVYYYYNLSSEQALICCYLQYVLGDKNTTKYPDKYKKLQNKIISGKLSIGLGDLTVCLVQEEK